MKTGDVHTDSGGTKVRLLLALLLALATLLRVWALDFGLPHTMARPDEIEIVSRSLRFFATSLNPHFFHYPSLVFYMFGAVFAVGAGALGLVGQSMTETLAAATLDPSPWVLAARFVSAAAGVATVAVVWSLGRALGGTRVGLAAALFMAVAPLHVRDAHFATTDITLTLFVTLAAVYVLRAFHTGARRDYALAGLFSGLAMSAKYVGLLMPGAIATAWLLSLDTERLNTPIARARWIVRDPRPWIFTGAWLGAFLLTTPYSILDSEYFLRHFLFQFYHLGEGHGLDLGIGGIYHLRHTLPLGVGWAIFLLAFVGSGLALGDRWREAIVLLSFPLIFYASTFTSETVFLRYMMPVLPFLCVFAGYGAVRIADRLAPQRRTPALLLLVTLLAVGPLARDVSLNRLLNRTDSRVLAADWLVESAGPGTHSVYQTGWFWGHLELPRNVEYYQDRADFLTLRAISPERQRLRDYERFQAEVHRDAVAALPTTFAVVDSTGLSEGVEPDYIILLESDLSLYSGVTPEARALLDSGYEAVHKVEGASPGAGGWYDQLDALFLPFADIGGVTRPGPDVTIFHRLPPRETSMPAASPAS